MVYHRIIYDSATRRLSHANRKIVTIISAIPIISHRENSLPSTSHANTAAEIGSMDESMDPVTAPTRRTPSRYALKDTTVPKIIILQKPP